jgi:HSP20 family protein
MKMEVIIMRPIRYQHSNDLFGGLTQLRNELDQMFNLNDPWSAPLRTFGLLEGPWSPAVDVYETADDIRVKAELPGLKKEDIDLTVQGETLILRGERKQEHTEEKDNYHRIERSYGQFHRTVSLPSPVNAAAVNASYTNGILEVVLPKREEAKPRQIQVDIK